MYQGRRASRLPLAFILRAFGAAFPRDRWRCILPRFWRALPNTTFQAKLSSTNLEVHRLSVARDADVTLPYTGARNK